MYEILCVITPIVCFNTDILITGELHTLQYKLNLIKILSSRTEALGIKKNMTPTLLKNRLVVANSENYSRL